ncbi:MAG: dienelactone hydrolase family protein [Rhodothermales bacterium]
MRSLLTLLILCLLPLAACSDRGDDYGDAMSREHADDTPTATPLSTPSGTADVVTEEVVYATVDGTRMMGFVARPATDGDVEAGSTPGLIVIHEWWGLNDNIRAMAEKLAAEGYVALAVDLYGGDVAETPEQARSLMSASMEREAALTSNVTQAYDYLAAQGGVENVGVIGWCFGGGWSLRTALALPNDIDAAAIYYGQLVTDPDQLATLDMPILGIFGGEDQGIPVAQVRTFEQRLDSLGANATVEIYEGAGHAFANPSGERYVPEAAEDAWQKTLAFFDRYLKGDGSDTM